jgi:hypothetical protein
MMEVQLVRGGGENSPDAISLLKAAPLFSRVKVIANHRDAKVQICLSGKTKDFGPPQKKIWEWRALRKLKPGPKSRRRRRSFDGPFPSSSPHLSCSFTLAPIYHRCEFFGSSSSRPSIHGTWAQASSEKRSREDDKPESRKANSIKEKKPKQKKKERKKK